MTSVSGAAVEQLPAGVVPGGRFDAWSPRPIAYVVCDVDGTLVGTSAEVSPVVTAAIARTAAAGIRVGYATGRMRDGVADLHEQIGAPGPHILHNGAEVRVDGRTIATWTLTPDQVDSLLSIAGEHDDCYLEVYTSSGYLATSRDERARMHWGILGSPPRGIVSAASDLGDQPVPKATFAAFTPQATAWLLDRLTSVDVEVGAAGSPLTPEMSYVNATRRGANKGRALRRASDHLGIPLHRVAAVGDAANDLSMLAVAGTAVAMGQAPAEIREAAHLVAPDVGADGVAVALDALCAWTMPD